MRISGDKTMRVSGGDATMNISLPPCPVCQTPGVPGEAFCQECGLLVGSRVGDAPEAPRQLPKLVDRSGREHALHIGENTVGRETADILLPSKTVSRRHAIIVVSDVGLYPQLQDTGSTNGTKHEGAKIVPGKPVNLQDGDIIQFGDIHLKVVIPVSESADKLPAIASYSSGETAIATAARSLASLTRANGTKYELSEGPNTFGRQASNKYVLKDDSYISGAHAVIEQENGRYNLIDLNSTNGTRLNGRQIAANKRELLSDGDEVTFGQTPLTFHTNGE
ncbi:MAG: FHA domain-containing protein [Armatimonadota bacterium]